MPIYDADVVIHRLDALLWLARLTQDGPLAPCVVCRQTPASIWGWFEDGVKHGLHLRCVETGMAPGRALAAEGRSAPDVLPSPTSAWSGPPVPDERVTAWVWERLAPWYDL